MENLIYIIFFCIAVPICMMLPALKKESRLLIGFMVIGMVACLLISEINSMLLPAFSNDIYYVTTNITPITEEIIKALAILFYAIVISDDRSTLIGLSFAVGVGFAILENSVFILQNVYSATFFWALTRGFATGLMHSICTMGVGLGISMIKKKRKLFYCGTFALLTLAIIYHATYNTLVQSNLEYLGFILPMLTYLPLIISIHKEKRIINKENKLQ